MLLGRGGFWGERWADQSRSEEVVLGKMQNYVRYPSVVLILVLNLVIEGSRHILSRIGNFA